MAKKTVYNINAIRGALVTAHNSGNKRNLTRDFLEGAGIAGEYFTYWQTSVEALRVAVVKYVDLSWNQKFDSKIKAEDVTAAREAIYPAYKDILSQGEADKETKKLKVDESDVERLVKFAWNFTSTSGATSMVHVDKKKFRLEVEKLMGCIIAKGEILTDEDRDMLVSYNKATKNVEKATSRQDEIDKEVAELEKDLTQKVALLKEAGVDDDKIATLTKDITDRKVKLAAERKRLDTKITENNATVKELEADVKKLRTRLQFA